VRAPSHILPKYPTRGSKLSQRATTEVVAEAKRAASHDLWLHPLTEHVTKEGQAVSTPFWPTGFPHEYSRLKPGTLFIARHSGHTEKIPVKVPRSSRANGPRPRTTSQQSPAGQKGRRNECKNAQRSIGDQGTLNSTPNVRTGQNRLPRRRIARTPVHATHGDIRFIQIFIFQAFQIFKLSDIGAFAGLGTLGSARAHRDLPLRSPTNPTLHRAVTGASVPTRFSPICHSRCFTDAYRP
ncbi:hypothetical protein CRG98_034873, partial [Punica granatum]